MKAKILLVLSLIGLGISAYLVAKTADPSSVACSIGGGCETVLSSSYAKILGISVATYGVAWYIGCVALIYFSYFQPKLKSIYLTGWLVAGMLFSLYLLSLEIFKIHAYCTWCLTSLVVVALMCKAQWFIVREQRGELSQ